MGNGSFFVLNSVIIIIMGKNVIFYFVDLFIFVKFVVDFIFDFSVEICYLNLLY